MEISQKVFILFLAFISIGQCVITIPLKRVKVTKELENISTTSRMLRSISNRLKNVDDTMFLGQIQVGNSKQNFDVIFDTGSPYFWVPSVQCQSCAGLNAAYSCSPDDGCTSSDDLRNLSYGTGMVTGYVTDFLLGVPNSNPISYVGLLINSAFGTPSGGFQGLVGLTPTYHIRGETYPNLVMSLYQTKQIEKPIASFFNAFESEEIAGKYFSSMTFGGFEESKIVGKIEYFNITEENTWSIQIQKFELDDKVKIFEGKEAALIDTGSTSFYMRPDFAQKVFDEIKSRGIKVEGDYLVDCNANLPNLSFSFVNSNNKIVKFDIEPAFYLTRNDNQCHIYIEGAIGGPTFVIGNTFLRKYLPIFDFESKSIGFARSVVQPENFQQHTEIF